MPFQSLFIKTTLGSAGCNLVIVIFVIVIIVIVIFVIFSIAGSQY